MSKELKCAFLTKKDMKTLEKCFPHIVTIMRRNICNYDDPNMVFRRQMLRNLYYLRVLPDEIINELLCCLTVKRYSAGATIIKSGDVATHLCFLREGLINIFVSTSLGEQFAEVASQNLEDTVGSGIGVKAKEEDKVGGEELLFDTMNTGSAFCAYTFLSDEEQQLQKFVAKTDCVVESISRKDFFRVARKYYELADLMDFIRRKFEEEEVDFDFFRFRAIRKKKFDEDLKNKIRLKFRTALSNWMKLYRKGEVDLPKPLLVIKQF